jgi:hypothetical protein
LTFQPQNSTHFVLTCCSHSAALTRATHTPDPRIPMCASITNCLVPVPVHVMLSPLLRACCQMHRQALKLQHQCRPSHRLGRSRLVPRSSSLRCRLPAPGRHPALQSWDGTNLITVIPCAPVDVPLCPLTATADLTGLPSV